MDILISHFQEIIPRWSLVFLFTYHCLQFSFITQGLYTSVILEEKKHTKKQKKTIAFSVHQLKGIKRLFSPSLWAEDGQDLRFSYLHMQEGIQAAFVSTDPLKPCKPNQVSLSQVQRESLERKLWGRQKKNQKWHICDELILNEDRDTDKVKYNRNKLK